MEALLSPLVLCNKAKGRISLAVIAYLGHPRMNLCH